MEDFDDLLDEFEKSYCSLSTPAKLTQRDENSPIDASPIQLKKCFPLYLGVDSNTSGYPRPCSSLRCIQCDFKVIAIRNSRWHPNTDYLFLRNNMPNMKKLNKQIERCEGSTAYACQCKHYSAQELELLHSIPNLQWICCGHSKE